MDGGGDEELLGQEEWMEDGEKGSVPRETKEAPRTLMHRCRRCSPVWPSKVWV